MAPRTRQATRQTVRELLSLVLFVGDTSKVIQESLSLSNLLVLRRCCTEALAVFQYKKARALLEQYGLGGPIVIGLDWIRRQLGRPNNLAGLAAKNGDLALLELAVWKGCDITDLDWYALALGNVKVLDWARARGYTAMMIVNRPDPEPKAAGAAAAALCLAEPVRVITDAAELAKLEELEA